MGKMSHAQPVALKAISFSVWRPPSQRGRWISPSKLPLSKSLPAANVFVCSPQRKLRITPTMGEPCNRYIAALSRQQEIPRLPSSNWANGNLAPQSGTEAGRVQSYV